MLLYFCTFQWITSRLKSKLNTHSNSLVVSRFNKYAYIWFNNYLETIMLLKYINLPHLSYLLAWVMMACTNKSNPHYITINVFLSRRKIRHNLCSLRERMFSIFTESIRVKRKRTIYIWLIARPNLVYIFLNYATIEATLKIVYLYPTKLCNRVLYSITYIYVIII